MRTTLCLLLLAAGCAPPEAATQPLARLPVLDDPEVALSPAEQGMDEPAVLRDAERGIEAREAEGSLAHAVALLRHHVARKPASVRLQCLLAQAHACTCVLEALFHPENKGRHKQHREAGLAHAEEAMRLAADDPVAHYWRGALLLHAARFESSLGKAKGALAELQRVEKEQPAYDDAGPSRLIGRIHQQTPFIGTRSKAIENYKKSIERAPQMVVTHLWLAETYALEKQVDLARESSGKAVALSPRLGHEKEDGAYREEARALLKKLE